MLKQGSVKQIRSGELTRDKGYLVVCMAFYPRGLKKELLDEYRANLAPQQELFKEWKAFEREHGHEEAFKKSHYEDRFELTPEGLESLRRLTDVSQSRDVYLLCQCDPGERCHREILLLIAQNRFGAEIGPLHHDYPRFIKRQPGPGIAQP